MVHFCKIIISADGKEIEMDSRPSDAMVIAKTEFQNTLKSVIEKAVSENQILILIKQTKRNLKLIKNHLRIHLWVRRKEKAYQFLNLS